MPANDLTQQPAPAATLLRRDVEHARIAGLCAGVSTRTGIDLRLLRISAVVLGLSGGLGVALYVCGWLLLPTTSDDTIPLARVAPATQGWDPHRRLVVTAVAGGATWLLLGSWLPLAPVPVILGLVLVVAQRHGSRSSARSQAHPGPWDAAAPVASQQFQTALGAWQARVDQVSRDANDGRVAPPPHPVGAPHPMDATGWSPSMAELAARPILPSATMASARPVGATAVRMRRRTRRRASWLAGLVVAVVAWLAYHVVLDTRLRGAAGMPRHHLELALATALGVVGLAMVVLGVARVRPRLTAVVGLCVCLGLGAVHSGLVTDQGHWAAQRTGVGTVADPLRLMGVDTVVTLPQSTAGTTVVVHARLSHVVIVVPVGMTAQVHSHLRTADLQLDTTRVSGTTDEMLKLVGAGSGQVDIQLDAVASSVEVRHG